MQLINVHTVQLRDFPRDVPKYVTASHRWRDGEEATMEDVKNKANTNKSGYRKMEGFAKFIKDEVPGVEWLWIDTCCIDQTKPAEVTEAVNSMFRWYSEAELCVAYLADVGDGEGQKTFEQSEWFCRGWTLQELLAPQAVVFISSKWEVIGHKGRHGVADSGSRIRGGPALEAQLAQITHVPEDVLHDYSKSKRLTPEQKLAWIAGRKTKKEEDLYYSLLGLFNVRMWLSYGEGAQSARQRLVRKIDKLTRPDNRVSEPSGWLSAADPWSIHRSARERHKTGTGGWMLQSMQWQQWKDNDIRHLWLYGKAGCGKTVLFSTLVEDARMYCETSPSTGFAAFYFSFSDTAKQSYDDMLRSLIVQLGSEEPGLSALYQHRCPNSSGSPDLEKLLHLCISSYDRVIIMLDALDECPKGEIRVGVLEHLEHLSAEHTTIKLLATSRKVVDIRDSMEAMECRQIDLASHVVDADIRQYISDQLDRDKRLRKLDASMKSLIETSLSERADGMFRWAYCQLRELKNLKSFKPSHIRATLQRLPATLDETYERMLLSIDDTVKEEALVLLRWLAYAHSPPSLAALVEADIIDPTGSGAVHFDDRGDLEDSLTILAGFVTVFEPRYDDYRQRWEDDDFYPGNGDYNDDEADRRGDGGPSDSGVESRDTGDEESHHPRISPGVAQGDDGGLEYGTPSNSCVFDHVPLLGEAESQTTGTFHRNGRRTKVRLAHFSVKEYLESERILNITARPFHLEAAREHRFLCKSCLTYLMHYSTSPVKKSDKTYLRAFPLLYYASRYWPYHSSLHKSDDVECEIVFLQSDDPMSDWLHVYDPDNPFHDSFPGKEITIGSALYYASCMGLLTVVVNLLSMQCTEVDALGGWHGTALQAASNLGHEAIVRLLLERGADVNITSGVYGTALQAASNWEHEAIVCLLVEGGADVNTVMEDGTHGTALQAASSNGNEAIVRFLLESGAEVNTVVEGSEFGTALYAASRGGHEAIVRLLLENGAEGNTVLEASHCGTPLQAASNHGNETIVRLLLESGAEVNTVVESSSCGTALEAAIEQNWTAAMQLLREWGAKDLEELDPSVAAKVRRCRYPWR